jgi:hypothetical protein
VKEKHVRGWTDPRLYTLVALRRRGIPAGAILSFISELGVTTAKTLIPIPRFEQAVRKYLEFSVPRLMLVLDPIKVVISDMGDLENTEIDVPFSPKDKSMGSHKLNATSVVYIERSDFREVDSKDYFRLAPGKTVGLLNFPCPIKATGFTTDPETKKVVEVQATLDRETKKAKAYIHWVPEGSRKVEVRVHGNLFKSEDPASVEGGFLNDINPNSESIYPDALIESGFDEIRKQAPWPKTDIEKLSDGPESVRFQAMRVAYMVSQLHGSDEKADTDYGLGYGLGFNRRQDCSEQDRLIEGRLGQVKLDVMQNSRVPEKKINFPHNTILSERICGCLHRPLSSLLLSIDRLNNHLLNQLQRLTLHSPIHLSFNLQTPPHLTPLLRQLRQPLIAFHYLSLPFLDLLFRLFD